MCETWSLTLREEHRQMVLENRVLRIFGPKRYDVIRGCRKPHNEELHNLYCSLGIIRMLESWTMRMAGHVVCMRKKRKSYSNFFIKTITTQLY
jgi:hypothetical protein